MKKNKNPLEFKLTDNIQIYIVECGVDIETPDLDSPFSGCFNTVTIDHKDAIELAKKILEYYES